jgi:hypothetical protein
MENGRDFVNFCGMKVFKDFHMEGKLLENYQKLYFYLFNHEKSKSLGINPKKGIFLSGLPGSGKSLALRVMRQMIIESKMDPINRFDIKIFKHIEREYKTRKEEIFEAYGSGLKSTIAFDESFIDTSYTGSDFGGKKIDLNAEMFTDRHLLFIEEGIKTHITSNVSLYDLDKSATFDKRVITRLDEMFNEIYWEGDSLRE